MEIKSTPHINPTAPIAKTVLLPGDPLRAKFIAETFLDNPKQFNAVRNILGYTGTYEGREISVMGTGMGMPSIGIYSYELMNFFGVENCIRIGSCGALAEHLNLYDVVIGMAASTNSNFVRQYNLPGTYAPTCSYELLSGAVDAAKALNIPVYVGNILSSDTFYDDYDDNMKLWHKMGILAVEMEAAALYMNAARAGKKALCMLTVSDLIFREEYTTTEEREKSFTNMMKIALNTVK